MPAVAVAAASRNGRSFRISTHTKADPSDEHAGDHDAQQAVDLKLERRAPVAVLARDPGQRRRIAGLAGPLDDVAARALDDERPGEERRAHSPLDGARLAGERRLVEHAGRPTRATVPSATTWSPGRSATRSPTRPRRLRRAASAPSRTTRACGATSRANRSSVRFARTSWTIPIAVFATSTPANSPSAGRPARRITTKKAARIRLNSVSVFARTMLAYDRLVGSSPRGPSASSRRRASASVSPESAGTVDECGSVGIGRVGA